MSEEQNEEVLPVSENPDEVFANEMDSIPVEKLDEDEIAFLEQLHQQIEYIPVGELHLSANKERKNNEAVPKVAASIKELGFRSPIFVNGRNNEVVVGHTRLKAAIKLGLHKVPVVKVTDLSPEKLKLLKLADNRVAEFSTWDFTELNKELEELKLELPDISFDDLGFADKPELDWDDVQEPSDDNYEEPDESNIQCPHCGYIAGKAFFKKPTEEAMKNAPKPKAEDNPTPLEQ